MAIITISRGTFAGGEQLATILGQRLGYRTVSREELYESAHAAYGVTQDDLIDVMTRTPTRFDQTTEGRRRLFVSIQASLCGLLQGDDVIYHGQAGHLLLPEISHVLRVRLIAPREKRIRMAMEHDGIIREKAREKIDRVDQERFRWTEFVFGANWADPALYDLMLNLDHMELDDAAAIVEGAVALPRFRATSESQRRMIDLTLSCTVLARLLSEPAIAMLPLTIKARDGVVTVSGLDEHERMAAQVVEVAKRVPGVKRVEDNGG